MSESRRRLKWPCPICGADLAPGQAACPPPTATCRPRVLHQAVVEEAQ